MSQQRHVNLRNGKKTTIPRLQRIKRLSLSEEISLAEKVGTIGLTSHNIASIVNKQETKSGNAINNFLYEFIWEEDNVTIIDDTPPHYLQSAAKRRITPCRRKRLQSAKTKLTPFKSINDLKTHRFHLAELFTNDDETKKDLAQCFDKIPSYYFDGEYEALPSKKDKKDKKDKKEKEINDNEYSSSETDDSDYKIQEKSRIHNLLLRDCKNHKILRNQQKLTNYLDIVEVNLLKQICIQSESFFSGLENIQLLQNDVCDILTNIKYLRTNLHRMEQYEVMSWSKIINLSIRQINSNKVLSVLTDIENLQIFLNRLNKLILENKYSQSVQILTQCKIIINKYDNKVLIINTFEKKLTKMQSTLSIKLIYKICDISLEINDKLLQKKKNKNKTYKHEINTNEADFKQKANQVEACIKSCILLQDASKSVQTIYNTLQTKFNSKINQLLSINTYHNSMNKSIAIETYIENINDSSQYIIILQNIYIWCECVLLSMQSICDSFTRYLKKGIFDSIQYKHVNKKSIELYATSSTTYCKSLCSEILSLCSSLLQSRDHKNSLMTLYELKSVFAKTLSFLQNIESITSTTCYDIRGVLLKQAQAFLDIFHKERINKLNKTLSCDKWSSVKVSMDVQIEVQQLQTGEKGKGDKHGHGQQSEQSATGGVHVTKDAILIHIDEKKILSKTCMSELVMCDEDIYDENVDDLRFKSVSSLICLIGFVYEYIECAGKLPPIAYDVENKLIELFTLFNSKTCQLVLGAGAMQTVSLKAITAKHLALAQQAISVLIILLPQIHKKWFVKIIPRNCLPLIMAQINRLNEDLEQHSNEIFKKLISIMEQLINYKFDQQYQTYLLAIKSIDIKQHKVHPSVSSLMIECKKMHRLMLTYMQSYQISIIFKPIVMQFEMKLTALITKIQSLHGIGGNNENSNENDKNEKRDMTQAFHSLNMSIKFISDKLNRLNCEAQHLADLCIDID